MIRATAAEVTRHRSLWEQLRGAAVRARDDVRALRKRLAEKDAALEEKDLSLSNKAQVAAEQDAAIAEKDAEKGAALERERTAVQRAEDLARELEESQSVVDKTRDSALEEVERLLSEALRTRAECEALRVVQESAGYGDVKMNSTETMSGPASSYTDSEDPSPRAVARLRNLAASLGDEAARARGTVAQLRMQLELARDALAKAEAKTRDAARGGARIAISAMKSRCLREIESLLSENIRLKSKSARVALVTPGGRGEGARGE